MFVSVNYASDSCLTSLKKIQNVIKRIWERPFIKKKALIV